MSPAADVSSPGERLATMEGQHSKPAGNGLGQFSRAGAGSSSFVQLYLPGSWRLMPSKAAELSPEAAEGARKVLLPGADSAPAERCCPALLLAFGERRRSTGAGDGLGGQRALLLFLFPAGKCSAVQRGYNSLRHLC